MKRLVLACAICVASLSFTLSGCSSTGDSAEMSQAKPQAVSGGVKKVGYGKKAYRNLK